MDDQLLFEQFHAAYEFEPRAGSFDRLRSALVNTPVSARSIRKFRLALPPIGVRLLAAVAIVVLAVASLAAFIAISQYVHPSIPVTTPHFRVMAPGAAVCHDPCSAGSPIFVSGRFGWLDERITTCNSPTAAVEYCAVKTVLFRTDDQGTHWSAKLTWDQPFDRILASPDGREILVLTLQKGPGPPFLYSIDGGDTWAKNGYPAEASVQPSPSPCQKGGKCAAGIASLLAYYFISPSQGWVLLSDPTPSIGRLYHTVDGGGHWNRGIQIDAQAQMNIDSLEGALRFVTPLSVWFVPYQGSVSRPPYLYRSLDGGHIWQAEHVQVPEGVDLTTVYISSSTEPGRPFGTPQFFNDREGVLELVARRVSGSAGASSQEALYVATTTDGGDHWSRPLQIPDQRAIVDYVDVDHWIEWTVEQEWRRTSDAGQHWEVIPPGERALPHISAYCAMPPCSAYPPGSFHFSTPSLGIAWLSEPTAGGSVGTALYETTDGGVNWTPLRLPDLSR